MDASVLTFLGLVNDLRRVEECFRGDTANIKTNPTQGRITLKLKYLDSDEAEERSEFRAERAEDPPVCCSDEQ